MPKQIFTSNPLAGRVFELDAGAASGPGPVPPDQGASSRSGPSTKTRPGSTEVSHAMEIAAGQETPQSGVIQSG